VHESADLRRIREHAAALLNELTARGIERVGLRQRGADAAVEELTQKLQAIGVVEGRALPALQPPRLIASGYGSGSIDPSSVTTAVEAELEKGDNRRMLAAAPEGATRHAFVWLHDSHWYVSSTLRDSGFPLPPAPLLPPEVDVGWVAVADGNPQAASTLLRVDASGIAAVDPTTGAALPLPQTTAAEGPPSLAAGHVHGRPHMPGSARSLVRLCRLQPTHFGADPLWPSAAAVAPPDVRSVSPMVLAL